MGFSDEEVIKIASGLIHSKSLYSIHFTGNQINDLKYINPNKFKKVIKPSVMFSELIKNYKIKDKVFLKKEDEEKKKLIEKYTLRQSSDKLFDEKSNSKHDVKTHDIKNIFSVKDDIFIISRGLNISDKRNFWEVQDSCLYCDK